jgi:hypothetical protein
VVIIFLLLNYFIYIEAIHEFAGFGDVRSCFAGLLVLVAWESNAEGLNPLTINHTPTNTSHKPPGREETKLRFDPRTPDNIPQKMMAYPTRPQTAIQRGTNLAL